MVLTPSAIGSCWKKICPGLIFPSRIGKGNMDAMTEGEGRPIQISFWYPAQASKGAPLRYQDYVHQLAQSVNFSDITPERQQWAENWLISMVNDLGGNGAFTQEKLQQLLPLKFKGYRDAPIASGQFPLVVFSRRRNACLQ